MQKGIKKEHFFGRKRDKNYSFYVIIEPQRTQRFYTKNAKKTLRPWRILWELCGKKTTINYFSKTTKVAKYVSLRLHH